eukprot:5886989-Amphidinium_carterae.1
MVLECCGEIVAQQKLTRGYQLNFKASHVLNGIVIACYVEVSAHFASLSKLVFLHGRGDACCFERKQAATATKHNRDTAVLYNTVRCCL